MKLVFLGTRGEIEAKRRRHRMHTSLEVPYRGARVMVDAGDDWLGRLDEVDPDAIVVSHAHPDHAWGLKEGSPCPVWATEESWEEMGDYPIEEEHRRTVEPRQPFESAEDIVFEAFTVEHSTPAPAVVCRITAGRVTVFYGTDMVYIHEREEALEGDERTLGATLREWADEPGIEGS